MWHGTRQVYLLLNEPVTGKIAAEIGLVSLSVPDDELMDKALEVATRLATMSQEAIRGTKNVLNTGTAMRSRPSSTAWALEMLGYYSDDIKEGRAAFVEKREPVWPSAQVS